MTIRIDGMDKMLERITTIQQFRRVKASFRKGGVVLRGYISRYPRERHAPNMAMRGNSPAAQRMRRGFFAHLRDGDIQVPYRRGSSMGSHKLGQSWTVAQPGGGFTTIVGTNAPYARLVQDAEKQTMYHKVTGWVTVQDVERDHSAEIIGSIRRALEEEVGGKK